LRTTYQNEKLNRYASIVGSVLVYIAVVVLGVLIVAQTVATRLSRVIRRNRGNHRVLH